MYMSPRNGTQVLRIAGGTFTLTHLAGPGFFVFKMGLEYSLGSEML